MRQENSVLTEVVEPSPSKSRLLTRLYREIGLAAVAFELDIEPYDLPPESFEAIRRGARYLNFELLELAC